MRNLLLELFGYGLASGAALVVDLSILEALVNLAGWQYLAAATLSFVAGGIVAYLLSVRYVFHFRHVSNGPLELGYFVGLGVVGLLVNTAVLFAAVSGAGLGLVTAKIIGAGCTFATNFTLRRQILFSPARSG